MSRRNQGARLCWLKKRNCFYITWSEHGRSRERSTGTRNREQAEAIFALPAQPGFAAPLRLTVPTPMGAAQLNLRSYQQLAS